MMEVAALASDIQEAVVGDIGADPKRVEILPERPVLPATPEPAPAPSQPAPTPSEPARTPETEPAR